MSRTLSLTSSLLLLLAANRLAAQPMTPSELAWPVDPIQILTNTGGGTIVDGGSISCPDPGLLRFFGANPNLVTTYSRADMASVMTNDSAHSTTTYTWTITNATMVATYSGLPNDSYVQPFASGALTYTFNGSPITIVVGPATNYIAWLLDKHSWTIGGTFNTGADTGGWKFRFKATSNDGGFSTNFFDVISTNGASGAFSTSIDLASLGRTNCYWYITATLEKFLPSGCGGLGCFTLWTSGLPNDSSYSLSATR